jgi:hypothetical protein
MVGKQELDQEEKAGDKWIRNHAKTMGETKRKQGGVTSHCQGMCKSKVNHTRTELKQGEEHKETTGKTNEQRKRFTIRSVHGQLQLARTDACRNRLIVHGVVLTYTLGSTYNTSTSTYKHTSTQWHEWLPRSKEHNKKNKK